MTPIVCPHCDANVKTPKDDATAAACPKCGETIELNADDVGYGVTEDSAKPTAGKKTKKKSGKRPKEGDIVEPDEGTVFKIAATKLMGQTLLSGGIAILSLFGMAACVAAFLAGLGVLPTVNNKTALLIIGPIGFLFFLVLLAVCIIMCVTFVYKIIRQERLILGETFLQTIRGNGELRKQLAIDNIASIQMDLKTEDNGSEYPFIGIDLDDVTRKDVLLPALKFNRENFGYDDVIFDHYEISLKDLFKKLKKHWKRKTDEDRDSDDD